MKARRDVFQAIADPTRRAILALLAVQALSVNAVAEKFDVSRPAISKHMKLLQECGLVVIKQQGRERYCEARPDALNEVQAWIEEYRQHWETRLDSLQAYLDKIKKERNAKHGK